MEKFKRIAAWVGIIILAGMYVGTLIVGIFFTDKTITWVVASFMMTAIISAFIYANNVICKILKRNAAEETERAERFKKMMEAEKPDNTNQSDDNSPTA